MYAFKTRLLRYAVLMTVVVIVAQIAVYWRTGFENLSVYAVLIFSSFALIAVGLAHLFEKLSTKGTAMCGLIIVSTLIVVTPILHPADLLHPTWYLVIVLYSYIFFNRTLSLIVMLTIYVYFLVYAVFLMPQSYSLEEVITLTCSLFVTAALCSATSRETDNAYKKLSIAANKDPMTELWNRRGVAKLFKEFVTQQEKQNSDPYSVAVFDLDNFKCINDQCGHKVGDHVICLAADLIRGVTREKDIAARLGGEEFVLILYQDPGKNIDKIAERIRARYAQTIFELLGDEFKAVATLSAGVVYDIPRHIDISDAMNLCDKLMYQAKDIGRNVVVSKSYSEVKVENLSTASSISTIHKQ